MAKLTLSDLASLANQSSAITTINNNSAAIETALENTLSRDGTSPNTMGASLDMNSNRIINLGAPTGASDAVRLSDVEGMEGGGTINIENNFFSVEDGVLPSFSAVAGSTYSVIGSDLHKMIYPTTLNLTTTLPAPNIFDDGFIVGFRSRGGLTHTVSTGGLSTIAGVFDADTDGYITTSFTLTEEHEFVWLVSDVTATQWKVTAGSPEMLLRFTYPKAFPGGGDPYSATSGIAKEHKVPFLDENVAFSGIGVYPLQVTSPNPYAVGTNGTIASSTVGQTFSLRFTSASLSGSPITVTYTAVGGDTVSTIAAGVVAAVHANSVLHNTTTALPIFAQDLSNVTAGNFNVQHQSSLTDLVVASVGTGTISGLAALNDTLDAVVTILGRRVSGYLGQVGDSGHGLQFMMQTDNGTMDGVVGSIIPILSGATHPSMTSTLIFSNHAPEFALASAGGLSVYSTTGTLPTGNGLGTITVPSSGATSGYHIGSLHRIYNDASGNLTLQHNTGAPLVIRALAGATSIFAGLANITGASFTVAGATSGAQQWVPPAVAGSTVVTFPPSTATLATIALAETLTNKTLTSPVLTTPQINDTSSDHQYVFAVSELAADRTVTLPLLGGNDTFVFADFIQTLTNKTLTAATLDTHLVKGVYVIGSSAVASSTHTGSTSESSALHTISIPANAMGANGRLRITVLWRFTGTAGAKTVRVKFNGTSFTEVGTANTALSARTQCEISNVNATNSQKGNAAAQVNWSGTSTDVVTSAHDTTGALNVTMTVQLADGADSGAVADYLIELIRPS